MAGLSKALSVAFVSTLDTDVQGSLKNCIMSCWEHLRGRKQWRLQGRLLKLLTLFGTPFVDKLTQDSYSRLLEPVGPDAM